MSSTPGSKTLTDILPDLCRVCRKIPEWYTDVRKCHDNPTWLVVKTASRGHLKCLQAALAATIGEHDVNGTSALMAAAWNGHPLCVDLLIKEKFEISFDYIPACKFALCLAADRGNVQCFNLLFKAHIEERSIPEAFENAICHNCVKGVRMLIAAGADVNQADECGQTPILWAWHDREITKALIEGGADPNLGLNNDGDTALFEYIKQNNESPSHGKPETVLILLEAGADVNAKNSEGMTPLMFLMGDISEISKIPFAVALLLKGAKVNVLHHNGVNALTEARMYGELIVKDSNMEALLFAAGEKIDRQAVEAKGEKVPDDFQPQFNLMDICRRRIREHLLELDPHTNLFSRVPQLGLPRILNDYLLYNQTLDKAEYLEVLSRVDDDDQA